MMSIGASVMSSWDGSWEGLAQRRVEGTQYWEATPYAPPLARARQLSTALRASPLPAPALGLTLAAATPQGPADLR